MRFADKRPAAQGIAALLAGAWRSSPPPLRLSAAELEQTLPLVARTNAAALVWWRLRDTAFASLDAVEALRDAYRYAALRSQLQETQLIAVLGTLRSASIEPLLIKGWDVARLYPRSELRPSEDIDLVVPRADEELAQATLRENGPADAIVDFHHAEISVFDSSNWQELYDRSRVVRWAGIDVRVLSPEDHLRAICLHGLKHCFSNPLWLSDIAAGVEAAGADFSWSHCVGYNQPQSQWIGCALSLARELLECELPPEAAKLASPLPRWLVPVVLDTWVRWATVGSEERWALRELLKNPLSAPAIIGRRWPNQLVVALKRRAPLIDNPRWLQRIHEFVYLFEARRIWQALRRNKPERSTP